MVNETTYVSREKAEIEKMNPAPHRLQSYLLSFFEWIGCKIPNLFLEAANIPNEAVSFPNFIFPETQFSDSIRWRLKVVRLGI